MAKKGCAKNSRKRFNQLLENWPNVSSWKESMDFDFTLPYQVTKPYWMPHRTFDSEYIGKNAVFKSVLLEKKK